jgi:peptidoglycan-associated lipoprotein
MKSKILTYLVAFAVALTLTTTGCRKKPVGVTQLPGQTTTVGSGSQTQLPPGGQVPGGETAMGGGPLANQDDLANYIQDSAALAADTVHFEYDSAVVKKSEQAHVEAVAAALQSDSAVKLLIEGHCDERGTEEYNRALGERRALALREALVKAGVVPDRIRTLSYGKDKPLDPGHSEAAWKKNRRGMFVLLHPKQ